MQCLSVRLGNVSDNKMLKMQCLLVAVAMTACTPAGGVLQRMFDRIWLSLRSIRYHHRFRQALKQLRVFTANNITV